MAINRKGRLMDCHLPQVTYGLRAYGGFSLPEDTETVTEGRTGWTDSYLSDDEDLLADDASGGEPGLPLLGMGCCQEPFQLFPSELQKVP